MTDKDDYVKKLQSQLETWNAEAAKWQEQMKTAQATQRGEYAKQLEAYRQQRDQAMEQMRKVQAASGDAWVELTKGADEAWAKMREAYEKASAQFYK
jgi:lipid II:glycine glycyltransferase (peptidoglycan interpeptide bridge formation enzyme)